MNLKKAILFWILVWLLLTLFFSASLDGIIISFFFVTFLMPVVVATSMFFNRYLVPVFLLNDKKWKFSLYLFYLIVVSIYLELLVMILAFVILADYQIQNLGKIAGDIYLLTIILYLIVLIEGLILSIQNLKDKEGKLAEVSSLLAKEKVAEISIRVNRKNTTLRTNDVTFLESLGDYVKVHTAENTFTTKEKISSFEDRLPPAFVRIHRSFIVNKAHVKSYNREEVEVESYKLSIGRKYKKTAYDVLSS